MLVPLVPFQLGNYNKAHYRIAAQAERHAVRPKFGAVPGPWFIRNKEEFHGRFHSSLLPLVGALCRHLMARTRLWKAARNTHPHREYYDAQ